MKAYIKQVKGITFVANSQGEETNNWVVMDGPERFGGSEAGSRPMELILFGLGGCTSMDVVSILNKMKQPLRDFEMEITAERAPEHPKVFSRLEMKYILYGEGLDDEKVREAIELSENKYCSVTAMLSESVEMSYSYEIRD